MCLLSIPVTPGEWFCSSCQGWPGLCSPLDGQSPEVIPLFSCPKPKSKWASEHLKQPEGRCCFFPLGCSVLTRAALGTGCPPSLQNSSLHQCHHNKTWFAGKLRSRYSTTLLTHKQQAFHLGKKNPSTILKTTTKKDWTMPNPANALLKFSPISVTESQRCPWEGQPQDCSHPASLHPLQTPCSSCLAISLSRDCTKQNCTHSLKWPWLLSFTTVEPEGRNTTPLKILLKQHF